MAEKDNVDDELTDDEFATLFPEKLTTVSAELDKLIEKRRKDPKFKIKFDLENGNKSIEANNKFNSRNASVIIPFEEGRQTPASHSESTFDPEDFESMNPDFGAIEEPERTHSDESVSSSSSDLEKKECPDCNGFSKFNKPEFAVYDDGARSYWHADPNAICPTCKNEGEIEDKPKIDVDEESPYQRIHEEENSFGSDEEEKPLPNHSKMYKVVDIGSQKENNSYETRNIDGKIVPVVEVKRESPEKSYVDNKTGLDSPLETANNTQLETPEKQTDETSRTIHSKSCKCNGTGIVSDPTELAKINSSDEFRNGIKKLNNSGLDENEMRRSKQDFIVDQYKCKEQM
jgi:hypothetical protein